MITSSGIPRTFAIVLNATVLACGCAGVLQAQVLPTAPMPNPRLNWVFPAGGKVGTMIDVTVEGFDLDGGSKLSFDHPGILGVSKMADPELGQTGPQPIPNVFTVTIPADVKPGIYELRVLGKYGLSSPRAFAVGTQGEFNETEPNNSFKEANSVQIGTTINGVVKETTSDYYEFSATKGQRIIIDCWAFRIDSQLAATLVLYDSAGRELDRNRHANRRDAMLDFTVPVDGEYVVAIYDFVYGYYMLPGYCFYRLSITTAPYLDFIFPPAGLPGSTNQFTLYGRNLPGGQPADLSVGGNTLEKLTITLELPASKARHLGGDLLVAPSEAFIDGIEYRLDSPAGLSNPLFVSMAGAPVVTEQEPNNDPDNLSLLELPCEVAGQFYPPGDRDWFAFEAKKGDVYWIEVISQRLGLPTDPQLVVQQLKTDEQGQPQKIDLHVVDDMPEVTSYVHWSFLSGVLFNNSTHDPACRFVIAYDPDTTTGHLNPIYESPAWANGFDVVIHDECSSSVTDLALIDRILAPHRKGLPAVILRCGMHSYRSKGYPEVTPWFEFTGIQSTGHGPQVPIDVTYSSPADAITRGLTNWTTVNEELYNNSAGKLLDSASALARGKQTIKDKQGAQREEDCVVVWTNNYRDTSKVFATTLGHNNDTVADSRYLDLVTRGLLWSCGKLNKQYLIKSK